MSNTPEPSTNAEPTPWKIFVPIPPVLGRVDPLLFLITASTVPVVLSPSAASPLSTLMVRVSMDPVSFSSFRSAEITTLTGLASLLYPLGASISSR